MWSHEPDHSLAFHSTSLVTRLGHAYGKSYQFFSLAQNLLKTASTGLHDKNHLTLSTVHFYQEFIGKGALIKQKEAGLTQLLGLFTIDLQDDTTTLPWGNESIYRNGEYAGYVTSAGFGHTLGKAVCMGYVCAPGKSGVAGGGGKSTAVVTRQYLKEGSYEMEINGKLWPASLRMMPPYDPKSKQVRS